MGGDGTAVQAFRGVFPQLGDQYGTGWCTERVGGHDSLTPDAHKTHVAEDLWVCRMDLKR